MKLSNCPFCNSEDLNLGYFIDDSSVHCASCRKLVILPISRNNTTEAIEQWNARPFEDHAVEVLAKEIAFYEIQMERLRGGITRESDEQRELRSAYIEARELLGIKEGE